MPTPPPRFDEHAGRLYTEWESTIVPRLLREAPAKWPRNWIQQALGRIGMSGVPEDDEIFFGTWLFWHAEPAPGVTAGIAFRKRRGADLPEAGRRWLDAQVDGWISIVEVLAADPDAAMLRVRDVLTLEELHVQDRSGSASMQPRAFALARLVRFEGAMFFGAVHHLGLPPGAGRKAAQVARAELELKGKAARTTPASLRSEDATALLLEIWEESLEELAERPLPKLTNFDGDEIVFTSDHYSFAPKDRRKILTALLALEGASREHVDTKDRSEIAFMGGAPPGMEKTTRRTDIGAATVRARALVLRTNSIARADALRARVEAACGELLEHRLRDHEDPHAALAEKLDGPRDAEPPAPAITPDIAAALRAHKEDYYRGWLDMPIPALGNKTPKAARKTAAGRAALEEILADIEYGESRAPEDLRFDIGILRKALGL